MNAGAAGFCAARIKIIMSAASRPPLQTAQGWGTLSRGGLQQRKSKSKDGPPAQMTGRSILSTLLSVAVLCGMAMAQEHIEAMKLLAVDVGWAATKSHLFWTDDNGSHWKDVTPPGRSAEISSVFFVDVSMGWVILARRNQATNDVAGFDLASTTNAGREWTVTPVRIPHLDPAANLPGDARVFFLDELHGWLNVGGTGSSAFNPGFLIATTDGGKTWTSPRGGTEFEYGGRGPIFFTTPKDGWFTDRIGLFVTHDAGEHWKKSSPEPSPQLKSAKSAAYDIPTVQNGRLFLTVTYSSPYFPASDAQSAVVLFSSANGGETWTVDRVLPNRAETSTGEIVPYALADQTWFVGSKSRDGKSTLASVSPAGDVTEFTVGVSGVLQLSFCGAQHGWVVDGAMQLLSTSDIGKTWTTITPERVKSGKNSTSIGGFGSGSCLATSQ